MSESSAVNKEPSSASRTDPERWWRKVHNAGEQPIVLGASLGAQQRIRMSGEGSIDRFPIARRGMLFRARQPIHLFAASVLPVELRILVDGCLERCELASASLLVATERLLECADFLRAYAMFV